jgi:site-specific recombinase XerD
MPASSQRAHAAECDILDRSLKASAVARHERREVCSAVVNGPTRGRRWSSAAARAELRRAAANAGVQRRFAPHQLRHAHAVEMAHEGVPVVVVQRQLGHGNLGVTSLSLQGFDNAGIIDTVHARRAPMIRVSTSLQL